MKSKLKSAVKYVVIGLVVGVTGVLSYVSFALPDVGEPERLR